MWGKYRAVESRSNKELLLNDIVLKGDELCFGGNIKKKSGVTVEFK